MHSAVRIPVPYIPPKRIPIKPAPHKPTSPSAPTDPLDRSRFAAWGRWVHNHRGRVLIASILLLVGSFAALAAGAHFQPYAPPANTESGRAAALIADELGAGRESSFLLVLSHETWTSQDAAFRNAVNVTLAPMRTHGDVLVVRSVYDVPPSVQEAMTSRDGHRVLATITLKGDPETAQTHYEDVRNRIKSDELKVQATDQLAAFHDIDSTLKKDLVLAEAVGLPLTLILLLIVFGSVIAALLPVGVGVFSVLGGMAALTLAAHVTDINVYATNVVSLIGLGVAIDYSLFVVSRYREELARTPDQAVALGRTLASAGRAVTFSGLTVAVGLMGLMFFQGLYVVGMGLGGALVVALAVLYALTLLPSILAYLGPRVDKLRIGRKKATKPATNGSDFWHRIAHSVMRRPVLYLVPALAFILLLGAPFLNINLANGGIQSLPEEAESRQTYELVQAEFPSRGATQIPIVVEFSTGWPLNHVGDLYDFSRRVAQIPGIVSMQSIVDLDMTMTRDDYVALYAGPASAWPTQVQQLVSSSATSRIVVLTAFTSYDHSDAKARDVVEKLRDAPAPPGATVQVTGAPAYDIDTLDLVMKYLPSALIFIILATYVLLLIQTGSVVLPLKAIVMNFLSITASFGLLVWIFQWGNLSGLLGFTPGPIDPSTPILLFCIVFGLSMDYEVFMLSRMHEEYLRTGDNRKAVAEGLAKSGRLITSAALIMVIVFGAFTLSSIVFMKAIGLGQAVAILMDATIVRAIIVPATMRLMGNWNWWSPSWLTKLGLGKYHILTRPPLAPVLATAAVAAPRNVDTAARSIRGPGPR